MCELSRFKRLFIAICYTLRALWDANLPNYVDASLLSKLREIPDLSVVYLEDQNWLHPKRFGVRDDTLSVEYYARNGEGYAHGRNLSGGTIRLGPALEAPNERHHISINYQEEPAELCSRVYSDSDESADRMFDDSTIRSVDESFVILCSPSARSIQVISESGNTDIEIVDLSDYKSNRFGLYSNGNPLDRYLEVYDIAMLGDTVLVSGFSDYVNRASILALNGEGELLWRRDVDGMRIYRTVIHDGAIFLIGAYRHGIQIEGDWRSPYGLVLMKLDGNAKLLPK